MALIHLNQAFSLFSQACYIDKTPMEKVNSKFKNRNSWKKPRWHWATEMGTKRCLPAMCASRESSDWAGLYVASESCDFWGGWKPGWSWVEGRVGWQSTSVLGSWPNLQDGFQQTRRGSVYFLVMVTLWKLRMFFFAARWHTQFYDDLKIHGFYTIKDVAAWQIAHLEWALRHSGWLKIHSYLMCLPSRNPDFLGWLL